MIFRIPTPNTYVDFYITHFILHLTLTACKTLTNTQKVPHLRQMEHV